MAFAGYSKEALQFLKELKANNKKEWFDANRKTYERELRDPTKELAADLADAVEQLTGDAQKTKIFRINRDVRFSKDKTPYNSHVHLSVMPVDLGDQPPAWMFGWAPDYLTIGCGVFEYSGAALDGFRTMIAGNGGETFAQALNSLRDGGARISEPALKRVPSGFPTDHPRADLLKHKGIAVWHDLSGPQAALQADIVGQTIEGFRDLLPVYEQLKKV